MPHQSEQTTESHSLPLAELNPLINPLLAENMGRWAEVYFTTPPENREQAVLELLRELQADKERREAALASELAAQPPLVRCHNCGHDNPAINRFCGMCGGPMAAEDEHEAEPVASPPASGVGQRDIEEPSPQEWSDASPRDEYAPPRHELSLFQAYRETDADENYDWSYEPAPSSSSRWYIGAVLAILILGLGYMAWRGMQNAQGPHEISAPPPVAAQQPTAGTQAPSPQEETSDGAPAGKAPIQAASAGPSNTAPPAKGAAPESAKAAPEQPQPEAETAKPRPANAEPAAEKPQAISKPGVDPDRWGSEELAVAEHYLNGTNGQRRDTSQAAKWLWKSIAKHNGPATLMLADLYLRGDGVPKNCDQARILLDSAARKGIAGAGERLRNLQAFGCQ